MAHFKEGSETWALRNKSRVSHLSCALARKAKLFWIYSLFVLQCASLRGSRRSRLMPCVSPESGRPREFGAERSSRTHAVGFSSSLAPRVPSWRFILHLTSVTFDTLHESTHWAWRKVVGRITYIILKASWRERARCPPPADWHHPRHP